MKLVLRLAAALAICLVAFDAVIDGGACSTAGAETTSCHACACGPHISSQGVSRSVVIDPPTFYAPHESPSYSFLSQESIFHPPRHRA